MALRVPKDPETNEPPGQLDQTSLLVQALAEVASEIERVDKRGRNKEQGYDFATAADTFDEIRARLGKKGVVVTPNLTKAQITEEAVESRSGSKGIFVRIYPVYTFRHYDGETLAIDWFASATDYPGDKAIYKALTSGLKYLLNQTFLISTGADDVESTEHERPTGSPPAAPRSEDVDPAMARRFDDLNSTLKRPWLGAMVTAKIKRFGIEQCIKELEDRHRLEHGDDDPHLSTTTPEETSA